MIGFQLYFATNPLKNQEVDEQSGTEILHTQQQWNISVETMPSLGLQTRQSTMSPSQFPASGTRLGLGIWILVFVRHCCMSISSSVDP